MGAVWAAATPAKAGSQAAAARTRERKSGITGTSWGQLNSVDGGPYSAPVTSGRWNGSSSTASDWRFNASHRAAADRRRRLFSCTRAWVRWPCGATGPPRCARPPDATASCIRGAATGSPTRARRARRRPARARLHAPRGATRCCPALLARAAASMSAGAAGPLGRRQHRPAACQPPSARGLRRDGAARDRGGHLGRARSSRRATPAQPAACATGWRATTPTWTAPSGNGTTSGSTRPSAPSTSAPNAGASRAPVLAIQGVDDAYGTLRQIEEIAPTAGPFEMRGADRLRALAAPRPARGGDPAHRRVPGRPALSQRVRARAAPGPRRPASATGPGARSGGSSRPPMRERCSRSTRLPTAASMRLTWWYLPSVSVSRSAVLAGRSRRPPRAPGADRRRAPRRPAGDAPAPSSTGCLAVDLVDLGHVLLRRTHAVDEGAVVAQQQQAGRVLVEPADRLHARLALSLRTLAQRRRQQRVDAGPGATASASTRSRRVCAASR